jgi:hypothetical protein
MSMSGTLQRQIWHCFQVLRAGLMMLGARKAPARKKTAAKKAAKKA